MKVFRSALAYSKLPDIDVHPNGVVEMPGIEPGSVQDFSVLLRV